MVTGESQNTILTCDNVLKILIVVHGSVNHYC